MRPLAFALLVLASALTGCSSTGDREATLSSMEVGRDYVMGFNGTPPPSGLGEIVVAEWSDVESLTVDLRGVEDETCAGRVSALGRTEWGDLTRFTAGDNATVSIDGVEAWFAAQNCNGAVITAE